MTSAKGAASRSRASSRMPATTAAATAGNVGCGTQGRRAALHPLGDGAPRRQDQHRHGRAAAAQAAQQRQAVELGQAEVEHDEVEGLHQPGAHAGAQQPIVFHKQDTHAGSVRRPG